MKEATHEGAASFLRLGKAPADGRLLYVKFCMVNQPARSPWLETGGICLEVVPSLHAAKV